MLINLWKTVWIICGFIKINNFLKKSVTKWVEVVEIVPLINIFVQVEM